MKISITYALLFLGLLFSGLGMGELFSCASDGCSVSANIIKIPKPDLYMLSTFYFILLTTTFALKNLDRKYFIYLLTMGIIFESTLFLFLLFIYDSFCVECFKVAFTLLLIVLLQKPKYLIIPITIAAAFFMINPISSQSLVSSKYTMITKKDCPHCLAAKKTMREEGVTFDEVNFKKVMPFLNSLNISKVPVLLIKNEKNIEVVKGDKNIQAIFSNGEQNIIPRESSLDNGFFDINMLSTEEAPAEGCTIGQVEEKCD